MKLLCLTPWFPARPGAQAGNFIFDSLLALQDQGHDVHTLLVQAWHPAWSGLLHEDWNRPRVQLPAYRDMLQLEAISHLSVPRNYLRPLSLWLGRRVLEARLEKLCRSGKPQVLLVHTEQLAIMAWPFCQAAAIPLVTVLHGINTSERLNTPAEKRRMREMLQASARVVLVGEPLLSHFSALIPPDKNTFRIVHNGYREPPGELRKPVAPWPQTVRFISVCNLHEGKGVDLNLQAFSLLLKEGRTNWNYTIVGDGYQRKTLEHLVRESGLQSHVVFTGAVEHDQVYPLLANAQVFVLPSWREAFGVAWLEAMACGLLAIATQGQGPAAFIKHETTGLLVPPQDHQALLRIMLRIIDEPLLMQEVAKAGQVHASTGFTWAAHAEKLASVCEEALSENQ